MRGLSTARTLVPVPHKDMVGDIALQDIRVEIIQIGIARLLLIDKKKKEKEKEKEIEKE